MRWAIAELHTHTFHSDGRQAPGALLSAAREKGLEFIALTDHNTSSGINSLPFLPGIEWTTYHGHMTVLGANKFIDWRLAGPGPLDPLLRQIKQAEGIAVIAHPRGVGSPVCTGCRWEHSVLDYSLAAGMEVWHKDRPWARLENELSLDLWHSLLDEGYHISAVSGLDWHRPGEERFAAVTLLGIAGAASHNEALDAIRHGRTAVTAGPLPIFSIEKNSRRYGIGDTAPAGNARIWGGAEQQQQAYWADANIKIEKIRLLGSGGRVIHEQEIMGDSALFFDLFLEPGWLSLEIWGLIDGKRSRIAVTSPIYIEYPTLITAHTGAMGTAGNQLDSLKDLLDTGVEAVEVDVRRHEGKLCLSHDIPQSGLSCPSLRDCFRLLKSRPRVRMNLDLKQPGLTEETLKLARECGAASRLVYTGDVEAEEMPMILANEIPLWHNQYILPPEQWANPLAALRERGFQVLNIDRGQVSDTLLATDAGCLSVWTVNEEDELRKLLKAGVRNITTMQPDLAMKLRREIQGP